MFASAPLRCMVFAAALTLCEAGGDHAPAPPPASKSFEIGWYIPGAHTHGNVTESHADANVGPGKKMTVRVKDTVKFLWKDKMHQTN